MNTNQNTSSSGLRLLGYAFLALSALVGLWAIYMRFSRGLIITNMTQFIPWGFWVMLYIYFIGLSAGSFLLSTLVYVFDVKRLEAIGPLALIQAFICMVLGMVYIFLDLGHPFRAINIFLYFNPTSVLAWESLLYTGYIFIILAELYLVLSSNNGDAEWRSRSKKWLKTLGIIGIPIAIGVHGGTGAIFAVVKSRPTWNTGLFPIIFLISALASGGALLTFLTAFTLPLEKAKKLPIVKSLALIMVSVVIFDLLLICSEMLVTFYGGKPDHVAALNITLFGSYWWIFWFVQIGIGVVAPIFIIANSRMRESIGWLGTSGLMVVIGVIGVRFNIVIPPQTPPQFSSIPEAFHHMRYSLGYLPENSS